MPSLIMKTVKECQGIKIGMMFLRIGVLTKVQKDMARHD
jgi:hypothetical protein